MLKWLAISAVVVVLDLLSKHWIQVNIAYGDHVPVTSFFDLVLYHNEGAAFSFLAGAGGWQRLLFSLIAIIASAVIVHLLRKHPERKLFALGLSLVLGGALGNLYDRVTLGYVVDFIFLHYRQEYYWPAFNIADSAITCGVVLLLIDSFRKPAHQP